MDTGTFLLQDMAIVLLVGGAVTVLFHYLRQPVVLGYILAGFIIGPHTPPFPLITDQASIETLSQLGIVMLMFSLGLQLSFRGLVKVGPTAGVAAVLEISLMIWIGYQLGRLFGWSGMDSLFLGALLLSSSTVIIVKALNDLGLADAPFARFIFGILVIDDIAAIVAIAVLSGIALSGTLSPMELMTTGGSLALFFTVVLVVGLLLMPRLLRFVASFRNDEILLVVVLGLGFGMALLALRLGFSTALGAFLLGAIIAETREGGRIRTLIAPVRDMFSAIFFVAIGLLVDPTLVAAHWLPILVVTVVLIVGKTFTGALGSLIAGNDARTSLRVGMGLAQIGEFAFIIAALGRELGVTSEFLYPIAVSVSATTTLTTPFLIKHSDGLAQAVESRAPRRLVTYVEFYQRWVASLSAGARQGGQVRKLFRRAILQLSLNLALITALFLAASALAYRVTPLLERVPVWAGGPNAVVFLATFLLALPILIATLRKLRAMAMLFAEATVTSRRLGREQVAGLRAAVTHTIVIGGTLLLAWYVLLISSAILPSWPILLILLGVGVLVALRHRRSFIQLYARAESSLRDTLEALPEPPAPPPPPPLPPLLQQATLETVDVPADSQAVGRLIRELHLRRATGATIVGIERQGESLINPGPDEEIRPEDSLLLLGAREHIDAARQMILTPASGTAPAASPGA